MINLPIGSIIAWENASLPSGWAICDGNNGTPDLRDKFVFGAAENADLRTTGGATTHIHTNSNTGSRADHNHGGSTSGATGSSDTEKSTVGTGLTVGKASHSHTVSFTISNGGVHTHTLGSTDSQSSLPRHILRSFIRRIS